MPELHVEPERLGERNRIQDVEAIHAGAAAVARPVAARLVVVGVLERLGIAPRVTVIVLAAGAKPAWERLAIDVDLLIPLAPPGGHGVDEAQHVADEYALPRQVAIGPIAEGTAMKRLVPPLGVKMHGAVGPFARGQNGRQAHLMWPRVEVPHFDDGRLLKRHVPPRASFRRLFDPRRRGAMNRARSPDWNRKSPPADTKFAVVVPRQTSPPRRVCTGLLSWGRTVAVRRRQIRRRLGWIDLCRQRTNRLRAC